MNFPLEPISFFMIMMIGYLLKQRKVLREEDAQILMKLILNVTLPMSVLHAFSSFSDDPMLLWIVALGFVCACIPLLLLFVLTRKKTKAQRVFYMINVAGYNIGCFTLPLMQAFFGSFGAMIACMFDTGNAIMMTGGSYACTSTLLHTSEKQESILDIIKKFFTSIPFDTYMIMLILSIFHIHLPDVVLKISEPIANANAFLAMLMLGILLQMKIDKEALYDCFKLLLYRIVFACFCLLMIYFLTPFTWEIKRILMIVVFAPISTLGPLYTMKCKGSSEQASFANSLSILSSMLIMSVLSYVWM